MAGPLGRIVDTIRGSSARHDYKRTTVQYNKKAFQVYICDSRGKIMKGLMGRDGIGADEGMLFIFKRESKPGFWMLNMKFSIDILWLDKNKKIVHIVEKAEPCKSIFSCPVYKPPKSSLYVLEFAAGTAKKYGMKVGNAVVIK